MSRALQAFERGMQDAEHLLKRFDECHDDVPHDESEVLKRAALVMIAAAWETYVEDRVRQAVSSKYGARDSNAAATTIHSLLDREIASLHNPSAEKVAELFQRYIGIDVTAGWKVNPRQPPESRKELNYWLKLRGEAIHRSPLKGEGPPAPHLVKRDELSKAMKFFHGIARATDEALQDA